MRIITWWYYWGRYLLRTKQAVVWKKVRIRYVNRFFLNREDTNQQIAQGLSKTEPFMVCRIGASEAFTMRTFEFEHNKNKKKALQQLCCYSGFFPEEEEYAYQFLETMKKAYQEADICGVLQCPFDDYFVNKYMKQACKVTMIHCLEPFLQRDPWTAKLQNKKVLVIHPFEQSIQKQYAKREMLFSNPKLLPEFELLTLKAVQTAAGEQDERFTTWFEALKYLRDEVRKIEFDIALLGCGSYGLPLAAEIKKMGKQAIHLGGGLQILFGIKGRRWDENPMINQFYNEHWIYPDESETPKASSLVENSCYWK